MASATFEDHPTDPDKVILRKPRYEDDDDIQDYKKPWVGLTQEERLEVAKHNMLSGLDAFAKAIERLLKEKNT